MLTKSLSNFYQFESQVVYEKSATLKKFIEKEKNI